jgi:hypothetical protein
MIRFWVKSIQLWVVSFLGLYYIASSLAEQKDLYTKYMSRPRFELRTFCVLDRCDNQLRHRPLKYTFLKSHKTENIQISTHYFHFYSKIINYRPLAVTLSCSNFFKTSPTVRSNSPAIALCFVPGSLANVSHRSPSTTALTGV